MEARAHRSPLPERAREVYSETVLPALQAPGYPGWLLAGVLSIIVYAAFANGATDVGDESRAQIALAAGLLACGAGIARGELGGARAPLAWGGVALLGGFAFFGALSVTWSIAPDESWIAVNRAAEYAALAAIVLIAAPSVARAPEKALIAFLGLAVAVALYSLGGKLFPTVSFGPVDFDNATQFSRLRAPLGYWNALGMLLVLAVPASLWLASDPERPAPVRVAALLGLEILLLAIALTYSRGAIVALAVAVVVMVCWGAERLRSAIALPAALAAAAIPTAFAFGRHSLSRDGVPAADRVGDGVTLLLILAGSLLVLAGAALWMLRNEDALYGVPPEIDLKRAGAVALAVLAIAGIGVLATSSRGITGSVSHQWDEFREPTGISNDPGRLLSSNGSNRWIWWREAAGAFSDRPIAGWGAGSFPIIHNQYREYETQVRSAHEVPLQFLAEGGVLGAALALGAIGMLFAAAISTVRDPLVEDRDARIALIAAGSAWMAHCLIDWDWEIPALTLPALAALAIAAAPWGESRRWLDLNPPYDLRRRLNESLALPAGIACAAVAVAIAYSSELPALADHRRTEALTKVGDADLGDKQALASAIDEARSAHRLNPFDEEAAFAEATLLQRGGDLGGAREVLIGAARTQPENYRVWDRLLDFAVKSGDTRLAAAALRRRIETEPLSFSENPGLGAGAAFELAVPAELSPTAYGAPPPGTVPP